MKRVVRSYFTKIIGVCYVLLSASQLYAQAPVVNFETTGPRNGCDLLVVNFTNKTTGATSYLWDFGDGGARSTQQNPTKAYMRPGVYSVTLTATNASGSNSKTITNYITVHANPKPSFTVSPSEGCTPVAATFVNTSTTSAAITKLEWNFGDGTVQGTTATNTAHTYTIPGSYGVSLVMADANGCTATFTQPAAVVVHALPVPTFTVTPAEVCTVPALVAFKSTTQGRIEDYTWDFGDGSTGTGNNISHEYTTKGLKTVTLTVTDANGCVDRTTKTDAATVAMFETDFTAPDKLCINAPHTFTSTQSGTGYTNTWFIDGVQYATTANFTRTFTTAGVYTIKLVSKNPAQCESEVEKQVTVINAPQVQITTPDADKHLCFDANEHQNVPFATQTLVNESGQAFTAWEWRIYNAKNEQVGVSAQADPTFNFPGENTYTVRLRVRDAVCGWSQYEYETIVVDQPTIKIDKTFDVADRCLPASNQYGVQFDGSSDGTINTWKWDIADWKTGDVTETTQNAYHVFADTGVYALTLAIEDIYGCKNEQNDTVWIGKKIDPLLYENFTSSNPVICYKDQLEFYADLNLPLKEWTQLEWQFYTIENGQRNYFGKQTQGDTVLYPEATSLNPLTLKLSGPREDSTGVFGVSFMPIQYECKSDTVWKDDFQTIFPPVAAFLAPSAVCDSEQTFLIMNVSKKARSYKWDFGEEGKTPNTIHYQLTIDTVGSGDNANEREWLWSSTSNNPDSLAYLLQWRTNEMGYTVTQIIKDGKPYLRESHDSANTSPYYKYKNFGTYYIRLATFNDTVSGSHYSNSYTNIPNACAGCGDDWIQGVVVTKITPNITISDTQLCQINDTLILKDLSTTALTGAHTVKRIWDFGDGTKPDTTTVDTAYHIYSAPQSNLGYPLQITTIDEYGCRETVQHEISVWENPKALFALDPRECANREIIFADNSTETAPARLETWKWIFETGDSLTIHDNFDGTYEWVASNNQLIVNDTTTKNPTHIFTTTGTKTPRLTVTDSQGCYNTLSLQTILSSVTANFELRDTVLPFGADYCYDGNIRLYNLSKTSQYSIQSTWDLGDGAGEQPPLTNASIPSQVPAIFNYSDRLNITKDTTIVIRLAVTVRPTNINAPACTDTIRKTLHISRPVSRFSADNRAKDCPPLDVVFSSTASTTNITSWDWSFGDNTTNSLLQAPQHTYEMPGRFAVSLTVTDEFGCEDTHSEDPFISVDGPTGTAIVSNAVVCVPFPVDFTAKDITNAVRAQWIFDDGNAQDIPVTGADVTIPYTYTNGYTFYPLLELVDAKNCKVPVRVNPIEAREIIPDFTMRDSIVCSQTPIQFVDISTSSHPITTWRWIVENTTTGVKTHMTEQHPELTLPYGTYKVSLEALIGGCGAEIIRDSAVQVYAMPTAAFITMKDTVNMFEELLLTNTSIPAVDSDFSTFYVWNFGDNTPEQTTLNTTHMFSRDGSFDVTLSAFEHENCADVALKTIFVRNRKGLPNVFTPNGDGINDKYLAGMGFKNIIILNRWGQTMYEGTDGWDGRVYGVEATPGTYFYIVTSVTGEVLKGALTLLRN